MSTNLAGQPAGEAVEFHTFEVDVGIVSNLIHSQNGTVATAIAELVSNSLDAGAKQVDVVLNKESFVVSDNGGGFADEASVLLYFKRFGTPHVEGDAKYGRFRIGRGQIMSFAKATWHSKNFRMTADVGSGATGFAFEKEAPFFDGCKVQGEFYQPLPAYEVSRVKETLADRVRYVTTPVFINQIQVNPQSSLKWDYEDDLVSIVFSPRGQYEVRLYSQGVFVKTLDLFRYGFSADVVTKQALKLNMARNEVNEMDALWNHVHQVLRQEMRRKKKGAQSLNENERAAFIDQFVSREIELEDVLKMPLFRDVRGKSTSIYIEAKKNRPWAVSGQEDLRKADQISVLGTAFVLSQDELNLWGFRCAQSLIDFLIDRGNESTGGGTRWICQYLRNLRVVPFDELARGLHLRYESISQKDLSPLERAQRNALQYALDIMSGRLAKLRSCDALKRKMLIGEGGAIAWTDSSAYVALNRTQLSLFNHGNAGLIQLCSILLHELTHVSGSVLSNGHDLAFYEHFHDAVLCPSIKDEVLGHAVDSLRGRYGNELIKARLPLPVWLTYRDPWVDCFKEVTLVLESRKPGSLLSWFLKICKLNAQVRSGKVSIQVHVDQLSDLESAVSKGVSRYLKEKGHQVFTAADFQHLDEDYSVRWEMACKQNARNLEVALSQDNIELSAHAADILGDFSCRSSGYLTLRKIFQNSGGLALLTSDPSFGVKAVQVNEQKDIQTLVGPQYALEHSERFYKRKELADDFLSLGQEHRFEYFKSQLDTLLMQLRDPSERAEFASRFFSETYRREHRLLD